MTLNGTLSNSVFLAKPRKKSIDNFGNKMYQIHPLVTHRPVSFCSE